MSEQPSAAYDHETVEWLLGESKAIISELANEVGEGYVFDKDEPPQLRKAREVIAEIDDLIGADRG